MLPANPSVLTSSCRFNFISANDPLPNFHHVPFSCYFALPIDPSSSQLNPSRRLEFPTQKPPNRRLHHERSREDDHLAPAPPALLVQFQTLGRYPLLYMWIFVGFQQFDAGPLGLARNSKSLEVSGAASSLISTHDAVSSLEYSIPANKPFTLSESMLSTANRFAPRSNSSSAVLVSVCGW